MTTLPGLLYFAAIGRPLGMCNQIVTSCDTPDKSGIIPDAVALQRGPDAGIEGWPGASNRATARRTSVEAPGATGAGETCLASSGGLDRRLGILDRSLLKSPDLDTRGIARQQSIYLNEVERERLRSMARNAAACGTKWMAFRGWEPGESFDSELRLVCQAKCGTRACAECSARIRARECHRVAGDWRLFFTFTMPRELCSAADAWRKVHGWVGSITRELRRESRMATIADDENDALKKPFSDAARKLARSRMRGEEKLEYAWVLEPHQDGWPHVHMVVNSAFISYAWLREAWRRAMGATRAWVYGEKVYSIDGACRYLSKYISKATLTPDILAIVYGRRLWACTLKRADKPDPKWFRELGSTSDDARLSSEIGDAWMPEEGWEVREAKRGGYTLWVRPMAQGYTFGSRRKAARVSMDELEIIEQATRARVGPRYSAGAGDVFATSTERIESAREKNSTLTK